MKTKSLTLLVAMVFAATTLVHAATNDMSSALQRGLFEEEANHNLKAAAQAYQSVVAQFDKDRKLAATAIFRLGEVYRKQGKTNEANAQYERILREFSDQPALAELSRDNLPKVKATIGGGGGGSGGTPKVSSNQSAEDQEIARIKTMIKDSPDLINAPGSNHLTPLANAAMTGQLRVAEFLLANGADVNRKVLNQTALHYAVENGYKSMVELLIANGADVNAKGSSGDTPLHVAAQNGFKAIAEILLAHKADVNAKANCEQTSLHLAVNAGNRSVAETLLENGANVNAKDCNGKTPLFYAAAGNLEMTKLLIANKADVNIADRTGSTPLVQAVLQNWPELVKLLLAAGANTEIKASFTTHENVRRQSFTGLHIAVDKQELEIVELLLKGGANPNSTNEFGSTPLHFATTGSNLEIIKALLAHGAKVNARNRYDNTPLHWAVGHAQKKIVELLLDAGADVNAKTNEGSTPLHIAIKNGQEEIALLLLKHKANPNMANENNEAPLGIVNREMAKASSPNLRIPPPPGQSQNSSNDLTALKQIGELLIQYGADENYERRTQISVTRDGKQVYPIFKKETNPWNRFSLLETFGVAYGSGRIELLGSAGPQFPFPNLAKIKIHRLEGNQERQIPIDLETILKSGDCAKDIWLEWGDVVEFPEADHKVNEQWWGFSKELLEMLPKCLSRTVSISVKGERKPLALAPNLRLIASAASGVDINTGKQIEPQRWWEPEWFSFWLNDVVSNSGLLRTSSDRTRVKVTRINPVTKKSEEQIFNLEKPDSQNNLWLRDGDVIEIPEKP